MITATVQDLEGSSASDSIVVTIHLEEEGGASSSGERKSYQWWWLIILIIIVLVVVMVVFIVRKKKKEEEMPSESETVPSVQGEIISTTTQPVTLTPSSITPTAPTQQIPPGTQTYQPQQLPGMAAPDVNLLLPKGTEPTGAPTSTPSQTAAPPLSEAQQRSTMMDQLERLAELKDQGILTEEEFNQQKQSLLKKM